MQTILVPIDFSPAAENALLYANKLAGRLPAELVLLHAGTGAPLPPDERAARLRRLAALAERLRYQQLPRQDGRRLRYHYHVAADLLPDCLPTLAAGYRADLVVTGLALHNCAAPAPGQVADYLPERVSCPVLVVPPGRHELPTRLAVAGELPRLSGPQLAALPALASTPSAALDVVQVYRPAPEPGAASRQLTELRQALRTVQQHLPHAATHLLPDEDALEAISEFCDRQATQLLVLGTADGCLLRRLYHPHYRQTHAYHLRIPVLLLPLAQRPSAACCARCALRQMATGHLAPAP